MSSRVPVAGDSADECRKRIMNTCKSDWNDPTPQGVLLRATWSNKAKTLNKSMKEQSNLVPSHSSGSVYDAASALVSLSQKQQRLDQLVPVPEPNRPNAVALGPFGFGDERFALKERMVEEVDHTTHGFVKHYSNQWKTRAGGTVAPGASFPNQTIRLSCQEVYGFCYKEIKDMSIYKHIIEQLRQFVSNFRRLHLSKSGRNTGPSLAHQLPLLVLRPSASEGLQQLVFFCWGHMGIGIVY